jgi:hypothetical protein
MVSPGISVPDGITRNICPRRYHPEYLFPRVSPGISVPDGITRSICSWGYHPESLSPRISSWVSVPEGIIRSVCPRITSPTVIISVVTWFITIYIHYWNLQFPYNVVIMKTKVFSRRDHDHYRTPFQNSKIKFLFKQILKSNKQSWHLNFQNWEKAFWKSLFSS